MRNIVLLLWLLPSQAYGQPAAARPSFDVATVKRVDPRMQIRSGGDAGSFRAGGKVTLRYVTLAGCVQFAYDMPTQFQVIGPDWIRSPEYRFEIVGQAAPDTSRDRLRVMLQTLLTERFQMTVRPERRILPFYTLTVAKHKAKLRESDDGPADFRGNHVYSGDLVYNRLSMPQFTNLLSRFVDRPVLDKTDLKGRYDINLTWTPDNLQKSSPGATLFTALQEQLGLRLNAVKDPLDVIVVENAQRIPAEN